MRLLFGDITKLGLKKIPYGAFEQIQKDGNIPLLDIGTIKHIREGHIKIYGNIDHIAGKTVHFDDGKKEDFDAIVAAIGYYRDLAVITNVDKSRFEDLRVSVNKQKIFWRGWFVFLRFLDQPDRCNS